MKPNKHDLQDAIFYFILIATVIFIVLGSSGCNPVKKVLKDPKRTSVMAAEIIKRGYCTNDTTIIQIHDTTTTIDTVDVPVIILDTLQLNDTLIFWETKYYDIIKTKTVVKQVDRIVIDSARINVLENELKQWKTKFADVDQRRKNWRNQFGAAMTCLLFAVIGLVVLIKYKK
jgi:hypothetical protein